MARRYKTVLVLVPLLILVGVGLLYHEQLLQRWNQLTGGIAGPGTTDASKPEQPSTGPDAAPAGAVSPRDTASTASAPVGAPHVASGPVLPPPPPLPDVRPEADQPARKEAFALKESVDHVVRSDEPFEAAGKQWTIDQLLGRPSPPREQVEIVPRIDEYELGSVVRKPIHPAPRRPDPKPAVYYGARLVRPGENLWNIHFAIMREYLARRDIHLAPNADEPLADGHSSGMGRLLKFLEGAVQVYDISLGGISRDHDLVRPKTIIVFFNISELFTALDQIQYADIRYLRFVSNSLLVDAPDKARELVDRRTLR